MDRIAGGKTECLERIAFQHLQHAAKGDSARAGRRRRENGVAAVTAGNRRGLGYLIRREILLSQESAVGARGGGHGVGDRTLVKGLRAAVADGAQWRRQILLHPALPGLERPSLVEEYRADA